MTDMKKIIGAIAIMLTITGCSNFDDINTNPNTPTEVSASLLCTNIILSVTKYQGVDAKAYISDNALPKYVAYANEGQLGTQYNFISNASFGSMTILPDVEKMLQAAQGTPAENSYKGIAHFVRAYTFYLLTMKMGDIPYSEAGQGALGNFKPKYDTQKQVFQGILTELEEASVAFAAGATFAGDPTPFAGDNTKWLRAVNAFELKVLMSLSNKANDAELRIPQRFAAIVNDNKLLENANQYLGLEYNSVSRHPLYSTNDMFTGRTILSTTVVNNLKLLNDKRLYYFGEPAEAKRIAGIPATSPDAYVGVDTAIDYAGLNATYATGTYSRINLKYQTDQASEPRRMLTYAEQQLILAEARIRGWISSGTAQQYYESGVKAALTMVMNSNAAYAHGNALTQADIDGYFTGQAAFAASQENQLMQIGLQRYLLNFLMDADTAYFEYRRTGYPALSINPATSLNVNNPAAVPVRYLYPASELTFNAEHLTEALNRQFGGYDEINKRMWILSQ